MISNFNIAATSEGSLFFVRLNLAHHKYHYIVIYYYITVRNIQNILGFKFIILYFT